MQTTEEEDIDIIDINDNYEYNSLSDIDGDADGNVQSEHYNVNVKQLLTNADIDGKDAESKYSSIYDDMMKNRVNQRKIILNIELDPTRDWNDIATSEGFVMVAYDSARSKKTSHRSSTSGSLFSSVTTPSADQHTFTLLHMTNI